MHACLLIPEIRATIFSYFHVLDDIDHTEDNGNIPFDLDAICSKTLASLARTCKDFNEQALQLLWQNQATLGPLIQVMPSDLWKIEAGVGVGRSQIINFIRPLKDSDWDKFEYYAHNVRHYGFHHKAKDLSVHADVFLALGTYRPVRVYLPNLQSITFLATQKTPVMIMANFPALLTADIKQVEIQWEDWRATALLELLASLSRICSNLTCFELSAPLLPPAHLSDLDNRVSDLIHGNQGLRSAIVMKPLTNTVHSLASLPSLRHWSATVLEPDTHRALNATYIAEKKRFPHLLDFELLMGSWEDIEPILETFPRPFTSLRFTTTYHPPSLCTKIYQTRLLECSRVIQCLANHICKPSLRRLNLTDKGNTAGVHLRGLPSQDIFLLPSLEELQLNLPYIEGLDDAWLAQAASTWPNLQKLYIRCMTATTLAGLAPLIKHCGKIRSLSVSAIWKPFDLSLVDIGQANHNIETLVMRDSRVDGPILVILQCLLMMFPNLKRLTYERWTTDHPDVVRRWEELQAQLNGTFTF